MSLWAAYIAGSGTVTGILRLSSRVGDLAINCRRVCPEQQAGAAGPQHPPD